MCMYFIIFINDLPKNGENNYDYYMEGLTMAEQNTVKTLCKMTSLLQEKEISVTFVNTIR